MTSSPAREDLRAFGDLQLGLLRLPDGRARALVGHHQYYCLRDHHQAVGNVKHSRIDMQCIILNFDSSSIGDSELI